MSTNTAPKPQPPQRIQRLARLHWVRVGDMVVSPTAQRERKDARVNAIIAQYDEDKIGTPILSHRGGHYFIVDGQHRAEATLQVKGPDMEIQCWVYEGLDEKAEAELFLRYNNVLPVGAFDKFVVGVRAERDVETDVDRIVRAQGMVITHDYKLPGAVRAVGTLTRVYNRDGAQALAKALGLIRDAWGDSGLEAVVIDGMGLLCSRYNGELDVDVAVKRLGGMHGGVNGLLGKAEILRRQTGNAKGHCVAAAAVDCINAGRGGKKLASWWKEVS
jgi:hypothetical protein